jgi:type VI secretion system protein ImpF
MAELLPQERLQPSLLDRLTDYEPASQVEGRERRVLSTQRLRESVLRDVGWLLNTVQLAATVPLDDYPQVAASVLNFGVPDLAGTHMSGRNVPDLERQITASLNLFEPRILRDSMKVTMTIKSGETDRRALTFTVQGDLWAQPVPQSMFLKTQLDLDTGAVTIADTGR